MLNTLISSILLTLRAVISGRVQAKIEALALSYLNLPKLPDESRTDYNNRRRRLVVESVQAEWPALRTALVEAVLALIVMRISPK
jgi:hypothetical protein